MISRHPDPELLVEYVSGGLSIAPTISITAHLQFCNECHLLSTSLGEIGGQMLEITEPTPVSEVLLENVLSRLDTMTVEDDAVPARQTTHLDEVTSSLPVFVRQFLPANGLRWRFLSPSLKTAPISVGEDVHELTLHRIKARGKAPEHNHRGQEITLVLKGSFSDEDGVYHPGDFMVREAGEIHRPFATRDGECTCLSVLEAPIELTGIKRVLSPFLSFNPS